MKCSKCWTNIGGHFEILTQTLFYGYVFVEIGQKWVFY